MSSEIVDVEVAIGVPLARSALGVFLYHPDLDGRLKARTVLERHGGRYALYPNESLPESVDGYVEVHSTNLYVSVGSMYVISPMTLKAGEVKGLDRAFVYVTDCPYDPLDTTERIWLAVHLPLVLNGKGEE